MDDLVTEIRAILERQFPGARVDIEETVPGRKVGGEVISELFDDLDQVDRQSAVWDTLRSNLNKEQLSQVGVILTLTPFEIQSWPEPVAA
jgi:acid stress-induced BolA-like protein IbaG/YrbA